MRTEGLPEISLKDCMRLNWYRTALRESVQFPRLLTFWCGRGPKLVSGHALSICRRSLCNWAGIGVAGLAIMLLVELNVCILCCIYLRVKYNFQTPVHKQVKPLGVTVAVRSSPQKFHLRAAAVWVKGDSPNSSCFCILKGFQRVLKFPPDSRYMIFGWVLRALMLSIHLSEQACQLRLRFLQSCPSCFSCFSCPSCFSCFSCPSCFSCFSLEIRRLWGAPPVA